MYDQFLHQIVPVCIPAKIMNGIGEAGAGTKKKIYRAVNLNRWQRMYCGYLSVNFCLFGVCLAVSRADLPVAGTHDEAHCKYKDDDDGCFFHGKVFLSRSCKYKTYLHTKKLCDLQ